MAFSLARQKETETRYRFVTVQTDIGKEPLHYKAVYDFLIDIKHYAQAPFHA